MKTKDVETTAMKRTVFAIVIAVAAFATFSVSLSGDFVYDDNRQIVRNTLIQEPALYGKALTSDVWAFKGDGSETASNYWRPAFTAWSILNFQAFGLEPFGWHFSNLLLHSIVSILAFLLLLRFGLSVWAAFAAALLFAVHPVHTESVAWIAGSPDLLFAVFLLGSLWFANNRSESGSTRDLAAALVLYGLALFSKEVAFACFPVFAVLSVRKDGGFRFSDAVRSAAPYALLATLFFALRIVVLGGLAKPVDGAPSAGEAILSIPAVAAFYLKQIVVPAVYSVNHALRPVAEISASGFFLPLAVLVIAVAFFWFACKRSPAGPIGFAILVLPLLPALNITAFPAEQIVHDRYLYLPLLGFLALTVPLLEVLLSRVSAERKGILLAVIVAAAAFPLAMRSHTYAKVWRSDLALWEHAVTVDANSASNFSQYGSALEQEERFAESVKAYNRSLDITPSALAYLGRARANIRLSKFEEAAWDLKTVTEMPAGTVNAYTLYQAYEALAVSLTAGDDPDFTEAREALEQASARLPMYSAALASKLAVVLYVSGEKDAALKVLEAARGRARVELLPESKSVIYRLGMLYAEMGRKADATAALEEYLRLTASFGDKETLADRAVAAKALKNLR